MSVDLSLRFIGAAIVYLLASLALGLVMAFSGSALVPAHVHLAFLGFVCGVIIATMYQQVPTLTGAELYSRRSAELSFWLFNAGMVLFTLGYPSSTILASIGALLLTVALYLFTFNIIATVEERKGESYVFRFYTTSALFLSIAASIGFLSVIHPHVLRYLSAHVHLALVGGVVLIIVGAMSWMLPMVLVGDIYSRRWMDYVFVMLVAGALMLAVGLLTSLPLSLAAGAAVAAALVLFSWNMYRSATQPRKMKMSTPAVEARFFVAGLGYIVLTALVAPLVLLQDSQGLKLVHAHLAALGIVQVVIGGLYHVIPTLAWVKLAKSGTVKTFRELYSVQRAEKLFYLYNAASALLLLGMLLGVRGMVIAGGAGVLLGMLLFSAEMLGIIRASGAFSARCCRGSGT
ncbi:MAG: cbb3-type cytochrome c oxidase subunit I [Euryarchaeota archaeon]|nr:cbb3-type cytochrome c oxidase subunit I [Euryarchaeota archaeon]